MSNSFNMQFKDTFQLMEKDARKYEIFWKKTANWISKQLVYAKAKYLLNTGVGETERSGTVRFHNLIAQKRGPDPEPHCRFALWLTADSHIFLSCSSVLQCLKSQSGCKVLHVSCRTLGPHRACPKSLADV